MAWKTRRSKRTPSASVVSEARLTASFVIIALGSDMPAIVAAVDGEVTLGEICADLKDVFGSHVPADRS